MMGSPLPCRALSAAHAAQSRHQLHAQVPCPAARRQLVCRAILSGKDHSRDAKRRAESAVAKAAADEAAVPLPESSGQASPGPDAVVSEAERAVNIVDAVLDNVIKAPYRWARGSAAQQQRPADASSGVLKTLFLLLVFSLCTY